MAQENLSEEISAEFRGLGEALLSMGTQFTRENVNLEALLNKFLLLTKETKVAIEIVKKRKELKMKADYNEDTLAKFPDNKVLKDARAKLEKQIKMREKELKMAVKKCQDLVLLKNSS